MKNLEVSYDKGKTWKSANAPMVRYVSSLVLNNPALHSATGVYLSCPNIHVRYWDGKQ